MKPRHKADDHVASVFEIDKLRLDEECCTQPKLYYEYAQLLADARNAWERAKAARDLTEADLDRQVRADPARFGVEKLTESVVRSTVLCQATYNDAHGKVLDAKHEVDQLSAIVDALEHRKKSLENLVYLHQSSYYAEPKLPREYAKTVQERKTDQAFGKKKREGP